MIMLDSLQMIFERLLAAVDTRHVRSLYQQFHLNNRLTGLVGPRGVGKTTLLLQYIKTNHRDDANVFYFSADHIYFKSTSLYQFIEELFLKQAINTFFIDEIHKYPNWIQELKNIYDGFPDIKIAFSGSSALDLTRGSYDLSRRAKMYHLTGMSFREYLNFYQAGNYPAYSLNELMQNYQKLSREFSHDIGLLKHFHEYLQHGFYPFYHEDPLSYYEKILRIIDKTINEDIANFHNMPTSNLRHLSKLLNYLASIPPGKISTYNLGKNLNISDKTAGNYLTMLNETGLVDIIYPAESGKQGLRKPEKVFLNNTNLHYALGGHLTNPVDIGTIRELAFVQATRNAGLTVYHHKQADYQIDQFIYEIGGKNKTKSQIAGLDSAFLVKDDITAALKGIIPLWYFGFLY